METNIKKKPNLTCPGIHSGRAVLSVAADMNQIWKQQYLLNSKLNDKVKAVLQKIFCTSIF